ncbi:Nuclear pore complex protein Nup85-like protein [Dinothrombium tinctorium]|uniref:Nuclear pore complex protein Nup85 n=1 Tax=Dinothrombium tinctorium TaxID=1965070 RepID=A0A3S4RI52_9ACAR|nr:Nuclear pore complex protein Nup85-like protein [Dinothrombium tinctorium]RWS17028.1 Nuclear pore complex protein Nup85-like protein [Dinothrombium tinctorium]
MSRALVSESSFVFKEIQDSKRSEPFSKKDLIKVSHKYRSVIHAAIGKVDARNGDEQKLVFNQIEIIWHLCEILFIDIHQTGILLPQLLAWIRWHHPSVNRKTEAILNSSTPHTHSNYWDVVTTFVLRGEVENALNLLKLHPNSKQNEFVIVLELLRKMPVFGGGQALCEYNMRWQAWSNECQFRFESGIDDAHLQRIVGLLAGDVPTFKYVLHLTDTWYHLMVSLLLYTDPTFKEVDISVFAQQCVDIYLSSDPDKELTSFDKILIAAFNYDLMQVIMESSFALKDNWWFVTHFVDLLYNGNLLEFYELVEASKLRESLILDYANSLMSHSSLWLIAVDYFDACPILGKQHLELTLERIPIEDERKALKIIQVAERRNLRELVKSVKKIVSIKWLARNRLGSALVWAIRSEDLALTTHIADLFLKHYTKYRKFPDEDVLYNLGPLMLICDRLIFLGKYNEFSMLRKQCLLQEAGEILVSLISSKISPKFFLPTLLTDSIVLLEAEKQILNSDQTFQILAALEDYTCFNNSENFKDEVDLESFKEKEDILRLAISRNMARSLITL